MRFKYRSSFDKELKDLQPKYYLERDKWIDFIFITENLKTGNISLSTESVIQGKIRLILLLFWRDIVNKLSSDTNFKLKLKLKFSHSIDSDNKTETVYNKDTTYSNVNKNSPIIRTISSIRIYSTKNFC